MTSISLRATLLGGVAAMSATIAAPALAQGSDEIQQQRSGISEIVVTARKREESLQDTPIAVTAVTSETLEARGIENFTDISRIAPNLKVHDTPGGIGALYMALRGISFGDNVIGQDATIGFYMDGVPYGRIASIGMDIVEPDSVQVLRGPQGTLFGRNTTAGAIVVQTHTPTDEFSGVVKASYGSFDAMGIRARIDTGYIGESTVKASFAYAHRERDGIQDNGGVPDHLDYGAESVDAYWGKIVAELGNLTATLSGDYTKTTGVPIQLQAVDGTQVFKDLIANSALLYGGGTLPINNKPQFDIPEAALPIPQRITQKGVQLTLEYAINDNLTIKGIGAFRGYRRDDTNQYGPRNLRAPAVVVGTGFTGIKSFDGWYGFEERFQKQSQKSFEVQILGDYDTVNFVLGGFYFDEHARDFGTTVLPSAAGAGTCAFFGAPAGCAFDVRLLRDYSVDSKSKAAFAQVDYRPAFLGERLELSAGVRYTDDSRFFDQATALDRELDLNLDNWSYLLGASYKFTDDIMAYVKYSTGYRTGGFNVRTVPPLDPVFDPEKIKAWEAGIKLDALDNRLRLNVAAFINKYNNLQISAFTAPSATTGGGTISTNANAEYKGFEVEATVIPVDGLTINGTFGYVDPEYKDYPQPLGTGGVVYAGCLPIQDGGTTVLQNCGPVTQFINLPKTQWDISAIYEFPPAKFGDVSIGVTYSWQGKNEGVLLPATSQFTDILRNPSYGLLGARLAVSNIPINGDVMGTVALFGRNLTDKRYGQASIDFGTWATRNFPDRRTMGIEAKVEF